MSKKGFLIIWNKWYFILIGLLVLFVFASDIYDSYDINLNWDSLKPNFNQKQEENYTQIYLDQIKDNLTILNSNYQDINCNGEVSREIYSTCTQMYQEITQLNNKYHSIKNGSLKPEKPIEKKLEVEEEKPFFEIEKVKESVFLDDAPTNNRYVTQYNKFEDLTKFTRDYEYYFDGKKYEIKIELSSKRDQLYSEYQREYSYYGSLPSNWLDDYYSMFIFEGNDDDFITQIIYGIKQNHPTATNDQLAKAVINLVQNIPYDYDSYYALNDVVNYPYETMYDNTGVCSDVSVLLIRLLVELDYEVAAFNFEGANHMAPGIKCPTGYGDFNSEYCFIEATGVTEIGYIPDNYGIYGGITLDKNPTISIYNKGGLTYESIINDKKEQENIIKEFGEDYLSMNQEQRSLTEKMTLLEDKIDDLESDYDRNDCEGIIYYGTEKERTCDKLYNQLTNYIDDYNDFVNEYNALIE